MDEMRSSRISPDELWNLVSGEGNNNFGVVGYESPKIYFDHSKVKKDREIFDLNLKVWARKEHYPKPKVAVDKDNNPIIPQRPNYIDDLIKRSKANFSKEKFDKYVEYLQSKGKSLEEIEGGKTGNKEEKKEKKPTIYTHDRSTYINEIFKNEVKKSNVPAEFQTVIDGVKEKHEKYKSPFKNETERMLEKYKGKTSLTKSDKVSYLSDSIFLGEGFPFYNSAAGKEGEEGSDGDKNKNNKKGHLFFPEKLVTMNTSPKFTISKESKINREFIEKKEEMIKEKAEKVKSTWESRRLKFIDDVSISYFKSTINRSKANYKLSKPVDKPEQYALAKERSPLRNPGPQQYFKTPMVKFPQGGSPKKIAEEKTPKEEGEGENKIYYLNREKTDKRVYKPMKSYFF